MKTTFFEYQTVERKLDDSIFPDAIKSFANEAALAVGANLSYVQMAILISFSTAIGSKVKCRIKKGWEESAMIWIIIIGEPGSKKTPALNKGLLPIFNLQKGFAKLPTKTPIEDEEYKLKTLVVTDSTIESLSQILYLNEHGVLLFKDEAMSWIGGFNLYKSGGSGNELEQYLSIFSSQVIIITRKSKPIVQINNPFVSFIGGIQVDRLDELANMKSTGFPDRILFSYAEFEKIKHSEHELSEEVSNRYEEMVHYVYSTQEKLTEDRIIPFTQEAKTAWDSWHVTFCESMNAENLPSSVISIMSKLEAYSLRFALILEYMWQSEKREGVEVINVKSVNGAIELVNYFLVHAEKTFSSVSASKIDKKIERAIVFFSKQPSGRADLRKVYSHKVGGANNVHDATDLIMEMKSRGLGTVASVPDINLGKSVIYFTLLPKFIIQKHVPKPKDVPYVK